MDAPPGGTSDWLRRQEGPQIGCATVHLLHLPQKAKTPWQGRLLMRVRRLPANAPLTPQLHDRRRRVWSTAVLTALLQNTSPRLVETPPDASVASERATGCVTASEAALRRSLAGALRHLPNGGLQFQVVPKHRLARGVVAQLAQTPQDRRTRNLLVTETPLRR
uniref:Uncharacterized protein n=1 Tax=Setaria viridis TaxID=4556 RepID=A0A4U6T3C0_SETVI|nr:hypothetical protein SEVIR_9G328050v2 [Setaria viridis]